MRSVSATPALGRCGLRRHLRRSGGRRRRVKKSGRKTKRQGCEQPLANSLGQGRLAGVDDRVIASDRLTAD